MYTKEIRCGGYAGRQEVHGEPAEHCGFIGSPCNPLATYLASVHAKTSRQKEDLLRSIGSGLSGLSRARFFITMRANATLSEVFVVDASTSL